MVFSNRGTGGPSGSIIGKPRSFFDETVSSLATEVVNAGARTFFDGAEMIFDLFGLDDAKKHLNHHRSGKGKTLSYTKDEMDDHPAFGDAIDFNRTRFEGTFVGNTGNSDVIVALSKIQDGQTVEIKDEWDRKIGLSRPSTYLAFGRANIASDGNFQVSRQGEY